jgi:maleylacetate reductase
MHNSHAALPTGIFHIQAQERIIFGAPAEEAIVAEAERCGAKRVFITSTRSLAQQENGPLRRIEQALGHRYVGCFAAIGAHSPREDVVAGARLARDAKAELLVAVGGGSVIDATKAMLLCLWLDLDSPSSMDPYCSGFDRTKSAPLRLPDEPMRMVSVSTTLSASEFTANAGITNSATHTKQTFRHRLFAPRAIILDPAATVGTPDWLLFCTGIRAVDHAVETYCNPRANPATEAASLQGLRLLVRALPAIKKYPGDLAPRLEAQFGMWQAIAAAAAGVPTGASHGIGYVLGGTFGVAHGHTSCVMLPAVLQWNAAVNEERQKTLADAFGAPGRAASTLVRELVAGLDQPVTLRGVGIRREDFGQIAERALSYQAVQLNPRPIKTAADVAEILELAW